LLQFGVVTMKKTGHPIPLGLPIGKPIYAGSNHCDDLNPRQEQKFNRHGRAPGLGAKRLEAREFT
jgi:hypothetical protein